MKVCQFPYIKDSSKEQALVIRAILVRPKTILATSRKVKLGVKLGVKHGVKVAQRTDVDKKSYIGEPQDKSSNQQKGETRSQTRDKTWGETHPEIRR